MRILLKALMLSAACVSCFENPVIGDQDVPDPGAILYEDTYYIVTTGGDG